MFFPLVLFLAVSALQAPTAQTEMLGLNAPDDFAIANRARNQTGDLMEIVQPPETVENWSKLITSELFYDLARTEDADKFYASWREQLAKGCPGFTDSAVRGAVDGRPAVRADMVCPLNPQTGKPELLTAVVVQGQVNLMIAQVAFRRSSTAADKALVEHVLGSLKICDQRTLDACRARKAGGFVPDAH